MEKANLAAAASGSETGVRSKGRGLFPGGDGTHRWAPGESEGPEEQGTKWAGLCRLGLEPLSPHQAPLHPDHCAFPASVSVQGWVPPTERRSSWEQKGHSRAMDKAGCN